MFDLPLLYQMDDQPKYQQALKFKLSKTMNKQWNDKSCNFLELITWLRTIRFE